MAARKEVEFVITARDRTRAAFGRVRGALNRLKKQLGGIRTALVGAIGGAALARGVTRTAEKIDNIAKASKRLGVGVGFLSRFAFAAELAGSDIQGLETGIKNLNRATAEADTSKEYADGFEAIGLEAADLLKLDPATRFLVVATAIGKMGDDAEQTAAAMRLFSRSGSDLIPLMENIAESAENTAAEADKAGAVISDKLGESAEKFTDDLVKLNAQVELLYRNLLQLANDNDLLESLGHILRVLGALSKAVVETGAFGGRVAGAVAVNTQDLAESARSAVDTSLGRTPTNSTVDATLKQIANNTAATARNVQSGTFTR